jgi:hypothetical protein
VVTKAAPGVTLLKIDGCFKQGCYSSNIMKPVNEFTIARVEDCSGKSCYRYKPAKADGYLKKACCISKTSVGSCSSASNKDGQSASAALDSVVAIALTNISLIRIANVDIEKGLLQVEHLVLGVYGMTCTRREKKLYRSLDLLLAISKSRPVSSWPKPSST